MTTPLRLATWNVNSLKVRLPQLAEWLKDTPLDVICLQETKMEDANFPKEEIENLGFFVAFIGQKTYNGVAILSRHPMRDLVYQNPYFQEDPQKRVLAATILGVRVFCLYVPNGQEVGSDKFHYKCAWLAALSSWVKDALAEHQNVALLGDFNIAPEDRDVHNPALWEGRILCSKEERAAFAGLLHLGFEDAFRLFDQPEKSFSWWDYRGFGFQKNQGLRIDHILLSTPLAKLCTEVTIERALRKNERPSDHAPVVAFLAMP